METVRPKTLGSRRSKSGRRRLSCCLTCLTCFFQTQPTYQSIVSSPMPGFRKAASPDRKPRKGNFRRNTYPEAEAKPRRASSSERRLPQMGGFRNISDGSALSVKAWGCLRKVAKKWTPYHSSRELIMAPLDYHSGSWESFPQPSNFFYHLLAIT
jgi:hypothetical protein